MAEVTPVAARDTATAASATAGVTQWSTVVLCALVCLLDGFDMVLAPVSIPALALDWQLPPASFSLALAASVLGTGLGSALLAPLGDRFGRRPVLIASFAVVGVASLLTAVCTSTLGFTLARLLTGLGMGASLANALALTSEQAAPAIRSRVLACVYASSALGGAAGGLIAPAVLAVAGWQGLYLLGGLLPLLLLPLLLWRLQESAHFRGRGRTEPDGGLLRGIAQLFAPVYRSATILIWVLFFLTTFTTYMISSWLPTLMHLSGWSLAVAARAVMAFSLGGIVGGFLLSWLVDLGRARTALLAGFGVCTVALGLVPLAPADVVIWMTLVVLMGAGTIGAANALTALASLLYPASLRAGGIGAAGAVGRFGATLAPLAGGVLIALQLSPPAILGGLMLPVLLAFVAVVLFYPRAPDLEKTT